VLVAPTPHSILPPNIRGGLSAQPLLLVLAAGGGVLGLDGRGQLVPVPVSAVGPDITVTTATTEAPHMVDSGASSRLLSETGVCTAVTALWRCGGADTAAADVTDQAREQARSGGVLLAFALRPTMLAPVHAAACRSVSGCTRCPGSWPRPAAWVKPLDGTLAAALPAFRAVSGFQALFAAQVGRLFAISNALSGNAAFSLHNAYALAATRALMITAGWNSAFTTAVRA